MKSFEEIQAYYSRVGTQNLEAYDADHIPRFDHVLETTGLSELKNQKICDFGCGSGYILKKLSNNNEVIGVEGFDVDDGLERLCTNLDLPFSEKFIKKYGNIDVAICLETFEHLTNPYNFVYELKNILKEGGLLYFSVPHEITQHNTYYPGLIYPVQNLIQFFEQMAFKCMFRTVHTKRHEQNFLVLKNLPWDEVKMLWFKSEEKFAGQPPHVQVNL